MIRHSDRFVSLVALCLLSACGGDDQPSDSDGSAGAAAQGGGAVDTAGTSSGGSGATDEPGGSPAAAGTDSSFGGSAVGGSAEAGAAQAGSAPAGGTTAMGGTTSQAGSGAGGRAVGGGGGGVVGVGGGGMMSTLPNPCRGAALTGTSYVPSGMCARVVATGITEARQITFSSDGALWVTSAGGQIRRLVDSNGDGQYSANEAAVWGTTGGNGQNVHIDETGGFLYAGTPAGVKRWAWSKTMAMGGAGEDVVVGQPGAGNHPKHTVKVWDGWVYVMSGSSANVANPDSPAYDDERSLIKRFKLSEFKSGAPFNWLTGGEVFANGLRNILGFNRDATGRIYGVQNGQDDVTYKGVDVHQDNPGEVIVRLDAGTHHGYPFCFAAQSVSGVQPGTQLASVIFKNNPHDDAWCQSPMNALAPVTFVQAHTAPMDIVFYTGPYGALPSRWKNGAFVSLHGSWDRSTAAGYKVVWLPFNADGTAPLPTNANGATNFTFDVVFGKTADKVANASETWNDGQQVRPVGIAVSPIDGALYISSDTNGRIYRVGLSP